MQGHASATRMQRLSWRHSWHSLTRVSTAWGDSLAGCLVLSTTLFSCVCSALLCSQSLTAWGKHTACGKQRCSEVAPRQDGTEALDEDMRATTTRELAGGSGRGEQSRRDMWGRDKHNRDKTASIK